MARLEEFDDVQLDVEFTQAGSRSNLTSKENIAISFGKIAKWYEALVPTGGSSGQFLGFNSSGTAKWVSNPNTDQKVKATKLAQSTADASYYPTLVAGEGTAGVSIFDSAKINHTKGTTSAVGNTRLILGNATNEGTTNNEEGLLRIYSPGTKYHTLKGAKITTDNVEHTLPTTGGTILNTGTTSFTQTLSSGTKIGTIKINGTSSDIYAPTNTDTKVTDTVGTANTYYPAGGTSTSTATGTQVFDTSFKFIGTTGTTSAVGKAQLVLGNATASGTANNKQGSIVVYGSTAYAHTIQGAPTAARTLTLPDKTGTFALTSDIPSVPTVNDAALTLKGAGTIVTTFTANASSAKSLDIVAGSNVTVTADATNAKISIASSHPTITKSTDTTSTASPAHGGTFTVVDSITREANGHVTKINTKTVTLPADSNTDTKVTQSATTTTNYRPILFGAKNSTDVSTLDDTITDQAYTSTKMFAKPETGYLYASAFSTSGYTNGTGAQLNQYGLYLKSYKSASLPAGGNYSYSRYALRVYDGKSTDNSGMLLTMDSGGLTIVGSGESAVALANLISDDQRDSNTSRTRLNVGGTLNTAFSASVEQLILSSDNNIYFLTKCNTIADRKPVVLDTDSYFYPGTTKTGSIGTSSYMWNSVYAATIYENGTSLASKYAAIGHTHTTTIAADSGTNQLTLAASTKYKLTTGGTNFIFTTPPNTTYSAGTGLSLSGTTFNHSNSVTARTNYNARYVKYDAQGHVTGASYWTATATGTDGEAGWIKIATIVHTKNYDNTPIMLFVSQRGNTIAYKLHIVWKNVNNTDPDLDKFQLSSDISTSVSAYIKKSATSTWELYIKKMDNYEAIGMHLYAGRYFPDHMTWTWQDVQTAASAITGGTEAEKIVPFNSSKSQTANTVLAAPNGSNGVATFRNLVAADIPSLNYSKVTSSTTNGKIKIDGTDTTVYTHPSHTSKTSGLYKITVDTLGHVSAASAVAKSDIIALGIPGSDTNTTYTIATGDSNGQIKVTPSSGSAYNVSVKGLGSAAYTASTSYVQTHTGVNFNVAKSGYFAVMANENSGNPDSLLPTQNQWWHILSMSWNSYDSTDNSDVKNWVSQLAIPTYENKSIGMKWRTNSSSGSALTRDDWVTVLDERNSPAFKAITQRCVYFGKSDESDPAGWKRILTVPASGTSGKGINDIKLFVRRHYNNNTPESFSVHIINNYTDTPAIHVLHAMQSGKLCTKIRITKSSDGKFNHVEIYYNATKRNAITIQYNVIIPYELSNTAYYGPVYPADLTEISNISDTVTAQTTIDIPTNIAQGNLKNANGYWGMVLPDGTDTDWIRTTSNGIIPYQLGGAGSGHGKLGTSSWYFSEAYIDTVHGSLSGNATNVTGTVAIAHGGTGATTRLGALKALTNEGVGTNAQYFLTITQDWGKGGYSSVADVKTVLGLKSAAYTESSDYATSSHTHGLSHSNLNQSASNVTTDAWATVGIDPTVKGYVLKSIRYQTNVPPWGPPSYGVGIAFGGQDTKALINIAYDSPNITFVGGNHNSSKTAPTWYIKLTGTTTSTYNLDNFYVTTTSRTANTVLAAPNGSDGAATFRKLVAADIPNHTHSYAGSSSAGGAATSANKLNTNAGSATSPVYFSGGIPVVTTAPASGAWFSSFTGSISSSGVLEVGRYLDFHSTNAGTTDYDVRLDASSTSLLTMTSNSGTPQLRLSGTLPRLRFTQTTSGKAYDNALCGISAYPGNTAGVNLVIQSGGNAFIGGGESPASLYSRIITTDSNPYGTSSLEASEQMFITADNNIYFVSGAGSISATAYTDWTDLKTALFDSNGYFRPSITDKGSIGTSSYPWHAGYINTLTSLGGAGGRTSVFDGNGLKLNVTSSTNWSMGMRFYDNAGETSFGGFGAYGTANAFSYHYIGPAYNNPIVKIERSVGTTSAVGYDTVTIGNSTASGTANNQTGRLTLYGTGAYAGTIVPTALSAARTYTLPNASGTISLDGHTHSYAGSSSAGGPATNVAIARVTKDSKVFPGSNKVVFEEYTNGTTYNLPSNHFYHIMSAQGDDTKYGTQLALGMTTTAAYYRSYNNKTWSAWKSIINSDTYDRNRYNANIKAGSSALVAANIIVGKDGVYHHLKSGGAFDITYPILYLAGAVDANGTTTNTYDTIHFTITTTQSLTLAAYRPVYIKGTLNGTVFTPYNTTPLVQIIPTYDTYDYIYLGQATSSTTVYLQERHPIYSYRNGRVQEITPCASMAASSDGFIAPMIKKLYDDSTTSTNYITISDVNINDYEFFIICVTDAPKTNWESVATQWIPAREGNHHFMINNGAGPGQGGGYIRFTDGSVYIAKTGTNNKDLRFTLCRPDEGIKSSGSSVTTDTFPNTRIMRVYGVKAF